MCGSPQSPARQQKTSPPSSPSSPAPPSSLTTTTALCRYKTGRCLNARAVKPNGALLLLCEFHRSQQNRTKKRSDTKYRHDRARKRLVERQASGDSADAVASSSSGSASESTATPKHLQQLHQRLRRRASPPLTSPSAAKCSCSAWPLEDVRLLAYFLF